MMVDGVFSSVGTANMDIRSFDRNFEVNALIYDVDATRELVEVFKEDLGKSNLLTFETFKDRPLGQKIREAVARLISPLL